MIDLFIGLTTWNSATFLPSTLAAVRRMTDERTTRLVVLDNLSTDDTVRIAREYGAEVIERCSGQFVALSDLFNLSRSELTLLIHADVVLLDPEWLARCAAKLTGNVALLSPEDIGCGPYTRAWGKDMPESSFLLFRTALARQTRRWFHRRRFRLRLPYRAMDFTGEHITYNLPTRLAEKGLRWQKMQVHTSPVVTKPIYRPDFEPIRWYPELATYRYGLGNFYSVDGHITHYHNWFERALDTNSEQLCLPESSGGLPIAFLQTYSRNFLTDLANDALELPVIASPPGAPL